MKSILSLLLMVPLLFSCSTQEVCDDKTDSEMVARFKISGSNPVADSLLSGVTLYGIREGRPDSLIYDSSTVSRVVLPLDPHNNHSSFIISTNDQTDTIRIEHNTQTYLISYTCGFAALFTILSVDHTSHMIIDSEIVNTLVDAELEENEEHLWLYY
jgi:hypothetical protein